MPCTSRERWGPSVRCGSRVGVAAGALLCTLVTGGCDRRDGTDGRLIPAGRPGEAPPGMVWIPGGEFVMGSDGVHAAPTEGPPHPVFVDGFFMDIHTVTNAEFRAFVEAAGYVTVAERAP
ncbi:MAG: SUMF1/EgtB/PvdO family nonheme iron enzyme, partial [Gemmatimonadetes bacterium]|nr:SUMF1/EgtB/PvdO family nonheme iron enzyme [Gemmatimonadota bacterium]